jgi:diguanylate cyclase (GGDEF)-like protein
MNGLKQVNDVHGHGAGDLAIKAFFQAVASALGDRGQAYRLGGDEVLVILPRHDADAAVRLLVLASRKLMRERLEPAASEVLLSISAGVVTSSDPSTSPEQLQAAADKVQYLAKERSKQTTPCPSVIAIKGQEDMIVIPHDVAVE